MKKLIIVFSIVVILLVSLFYVKSKIFPFATSMLEKAIGLRVVWSHADVRFRPWILEVDLEGVTLSGFVHGRIKNLSLTVNLKKGLWFQYVRLSSFSGEIKVPLEKKVLFSLPPIEFLEADDGSFTLEGKKIIVRKAKIEGLIPGRPFTFYGRGAIEPFFKEGTFHIRGIYGEGFSTLKGYCDVKGLSLFSLNGYVQGKTDLNGTFTFEEGQLTLGGQIKTEDVSVRSEVLKEPYRFIGAKGSFKVVTFREKFSLTTSLMNSDGIHMDIILHLKEGKLKDLTLRTNRMGMEFFKRYVRLEKLTGSDPLDHVVTGKIRIEKLSYTDDPPSLYTTISLSETSFYLNRFLFEEVEGQMELDNDKVRISNAKARYRSSYVRELVGEIILNEERGKLRGAFFSDLSDFSEYLKSNEFRVYEGCAKGNFELSWDKTGDIVYSGEAEIANGRGHLYGTDVEFKGKIRFSNDSIELKPIFLSHMGTGLNLFGSVGKNSEFDLLVNGDVSSESIRSLVHLPFKELDGLLRVDLRMKKWQDELSLIGKFDLTDLSILLPGTFTKSQGVNCDLALSVEKRDERIEVKDLNLNLGSLNLKGSGKGDPQRMDCDFSLDVEDTSQLASHFFLQDFSQKGNLKANVSVRDLLFSLEKLPYVRGYVEIENGFFKLPTFKAPISSINLRAHFEGEKMDVIVYKAKMGNSLLRSAEIKVEGLEEPHFSGYLHLERIETSDFEEEEKSTLIFPVLKEGDLAWRSRISMRLMVDEIYHNRTLLPGLSLRISKEGSHISFEGDTLFFGGKAELVGKLALSEPKPQFNCQMKITGIEMKEVSSALGWDDILEGRATFSVKLNSKGKTLEEMGENLSGQIIALAKNGTIRKWNLLARILEFLNLYQTIKLKLDFAREGLFYERMGGSFTVSQGILHTENFTIHSPSMIIVGKGDIDIFHDRIKGSFSVSPLVALEKTIDKIPLLRNILRREKGFITVEYKVNGRLSDPEIRVDVVKTVPGKIFDILKNILILPRDIIELDTGK